MRGARPEILLLIVTALLLTLLYPAIFMNCRLAPEASLKGQPPWRVQWGPFPNPSPLAVEAATTFGPRLAGIARDGLSVALWNPWIGGGRPGWLSSPAEGGAPLALPAAMLARTGWAWTALLCLELALALASAFWVVSLLGAQPWPAAIGATAYALSGPVVGTWLGWQGSALALGPLALVPVLAAPKRATHRAAAWAAVLLVLAASGAPSVPFIALAVALEILARPLLGRPVRWGAPLVAVALVLALALPALWLERSGGETGAPHATVPPSPAVARLVDFVSPPPPPDGTPVTTGVRVPAYLGGATLLLAVVGVVRLPSRRRGFWLGALGVSIVLATLPATLLARVGVEQRPLGVVALAAAVFAAFGAQLLGERLRSGGAKTVLGLAVWLLVMFPLIAPAAQRLPFVPAAEARLPSPIPAERASATTRMVGLLGMLPPDIGATLGLADVRAISFPREPRYAALLAAGHAGELSVSRALDPQTARLAARWLLEPLPLHVVSGELFARIEPRDLRARRERSPDGLSRFGADVPPEACRLGLPARSAPDTVWLERPGLRSQLGPDAALASESDDWRWFAVPRSWPPGPATLAVPAIHTESGLMHVAWDASGLRVTREEKGVRVWDWGLARPLAFVATGLRPEGGPVPARPTVVTVPADRVSGLMPLVADSSGRTDVTGSTPTLVEIRVSVPHASLLVVQIKHRPALWRAAVEGHAVATERVDGVWTGVALPAGVSHVVLRARLPFAAWFGAGAALVTLGALAWPRRES
jgi:hypothetical protein